MMLSHFPHRHLLLYCHVTSRIYTSLCRRKSNLDQSQLEVGVSASPHLTAAVSAPHDVTRCPELQQKRVKMLWKQDCSISESEPTETSHLLQALVQRFNAIQLYLQGLPTCMRDPLFFLSPLVHFPLLFIIRAHLPSFYQWIFWVLLTTEVTYCFQQESAIASHEWGRFPTSLVINISTAWA